MSVDTTPALRLQMTEPVACELRAEGLRHHGHAVWLENGKAHLVLPERLHPGHESLLSLHHGPIRVNLLATVLLHRVLPDTEGQRQILHVCSLVTPQGASRGFQALLERVNPRTAELDPLSISAATHRGRRRPRIPTPAPSTRARPRLPAARPIPQNIPRPGPDAQAERRGHPRPEHQRGLQSHELARVRHWPGPPPRLEVCFQDTEHWHRSSRWSHGWLRLVLADTFEAPDGVALNVTLVLPTGASCRFQARVIRQGRERILLEATCLSPATQDALNHATTEALRR